MAVEFTQEVTEERSEFKIAFGGKKHEINIEAYASSLLTINDILSRIAQELDPGHPVEIRVVAEKPGSFESVIEVVRRVGPFIAAHAPDVVDVAKSTIQGFVGWLQLKRELKGEKPKSVTSKDGRMTFEAVNGNVISIESFAGNLYLSNTYVNEKGVKLFQKLNDHEPVQSLSVSAESVPEIRVDRTEFQGMTAENVSLAPEEKATRQVLDRSQIRLGVYSIVFDQDKSWKFNYDGHRIQAKMLDRAFMGDVLKKTVSFTNGDALEADLKIHQVWNKEIEWWENTSYEVVKVYRVIKSGTQSQMGL